MSDLGLFLLILVLHGTTFAFLQTAGLRRHRPRRILVYLLGTYVLSAAIVTTCATVWLRPVFSSHACYLVATAGAVSTGFFATGLYAFLGPATADRSCTAHFLMLLRTQPDYCQSRERLVERFDSRGFMEKRFEECERAGLIDCQAGAVMLTPKGLRFANLYSNQLRWLHLDRRVEFQLSFSPPRKSEDLVAV